MNFIGTKRYKKKQKRHSELEVDNFSHDFHLEWKPAQQYQGFNMKVAIEQKRKINKTKSNMSQLLASDQLKNSDITRTERISEIVSSTNLGEALEIDDEIKVEVGDVQIQCQQSSFQSSNFQQPTVVETKQKSKYETYLASQLIQDLKQNQIIKQSKQKFKLQDLSNENSPRLFPNIMNVKYSRFQHNKFVPEFSRNMCQSVQRLSDSNTGRRSMFDISDVTSRSRVVEIDRLPFMSFQNKFQDRFSLIQSHHKLEFQKIVQKQNQSQIEIKIPKISKRSSLPDIFPQKFQVEETQIEPSSDPYSYFQSKVQSPKIFNISVGQASTQKKQEEQTNDSNQINENVDLNTSEYSNKVNENADNINQDSNEVINVIIQEDFTQNETAGDQSFQTPFLGKETTEQSINEAKTQDQLPEIPIIQVEKINDALQHLKKLQKTKKEGPKRNVETTHDTSRTNLTQVKKQNLQEFTYREIQKKALEIQKKKKKQTQKKNKINQKKLQKRSNSLDILSPKSFDIECLKRSTSLQVLKNSKLPIKKKKKTIRQRRKHTQDKIHKAKQDQIKQIKILKQQFYQDLMAEVQKREAKQLEQQSPSPEDIQRQPLGIQTQTSSQKPKEQLELEVKKLKSIFQEKLKLRVEQNIFKATEEGKKKYLEKMRRLEEKKRDKLFHKAIRNPKSILYMRKNLKKQSVSPQKNLQRFFTFKKTIKRGKSICIKNENGELEQLYDESSSEEQNKDFTDSQILPYGTFKGQEEPKRFLLDDTRVEALEFDGKPLPADFLMAKLALSQSHKDMYQEKMNRDSNNEFKNSTQFNFFKADLYHDENSDFNKQFEREQIYPDIIEQGLEKMIKEFQLKLDFLQSIKDNNKVCNKQRSIASETYQKFVKNALDMGHLPLPILLRIKKGILYIPSSYTVTEGLSIAMRESMTNLEFININYLNRAIFDKNNMTDKVFANCLEGLRKRKEFCQLSSSCNEIGKLSSEQICKLLSNKDLANLKELRLISNKCVPECLDRIFESMKISNHLHKVVLQNMHMSDRQLQIFFEYIKESGIVSEVDISWNKLTSYQIQKLFASLEQNRTIQHLSLGYIKLNYCEPVIDKFYQFLQKNNKLTHLDLTATDIPDKIMQELFRNLKRNQSLQVVHLCGNQISTDALMIMTLKLKPQYTDGLQERSQQKQKFIRRVNEYLKINFLDVIAQKYESFRKKEINVEWMSVRKPYEKVEKPYIPQPIDVMKAKNLLQNTARQMFQNKCKIHVHKCNNLGQPQQIQDFIQHLQPMILTKKLGHKEIPNSHLWRISNECWMCDKHRYTLIFWDVELGQRFQIYNPILEDMFQEMIDNYSDVFKQHAEVHEDSKAFIIGSFTNWEPRRMMLVHELCAHLMKENQAFYCKENSIQFANEVKSYYFGLLQGSYPYTDPQIINHPIEELMRTKEPDYFGNRLFVYCDFIKPGNHQYLVSYKSVITEVQTARKSKINIVSYHQFLGSAHLGGYKPSLKHNVLSSLDRNFETKRSIFREWRLDKNKKRIQEGFKQEISYWKVPNFIKDEIECMQITKYMEKKSELLKTIFIMRACQSNYPVIQRLNFQYFVQEMNLIDEQFDISASDRIFIAVTKNMDKRLIGILPEKDMSRLQFYESLVRIAYFKYKLNPLLKINTTYEGLQYLIEEVLEFKYKTYQWMGWRIEKLWTLEVDDLFKSNQMAMQLLYKYFFLKNKCKILTLNDAHDLIGIAELSILPETINYCWGMSKMFIENDVMDRKQYSTMILVEFLEFFARIADSYFKEQIPLCKKVENLMDLMFPLINMKRKEVNIEIDYISNSEEEIEEENYYK